ncbi:MAG TPA: hypothetical protein VIF37_17135 [Methylobacter sp.]|jgi:hypothetical protein
MMNNKVIILLVLTSALMSSCAKTVWINPNIPDQQAEKDLAECQNNAMRKNELMKSCMSSKGYHTVAEK